MNNSLKLALPLCGVASLSIASAMAQQKPNVIIILTDDMGYSDIGCFGGDFAPTPNLDRMAKEGIAFSQYYSMSPISSPSRVGMMTGMNPAKWNITSFLQTREGNRRCEQNDFLDPSAPTIAKMMKSNGYRTGHFGKWHMGGGRDVENAPSIKQYGFDDYISTYESPDPDPLLTSTDWIWAKSDSIKRPDRTAYFVDKTLEFLKNNAGTPCFVNLWPDDVHTPWVPSDERLREHSAPQEELRKFKAVLDEYDRQMGRLFDGLKELGIDDNTIVIFTSDNGPDPLCHEARDNAFRGIKMSLYEGGTRLPFIVRWPAGTPAGRIDSTSVICSADLMPSLCTLVGGELPWEFNFDGENRLSALQGSPSKRTKPIFWEYGRNDTSFYYPKPYHRSPNCAMRQGKWKLLVNNDGSRTELYNIKKDSRETTNLAIKKPGRARRMRLELLEWRWTLPKYQGDE